MRIRHSWSACIDAAGAEAAHVLADSKLGGFAEFNQFQAGELSADDYLDALARHLGLNSLADARAVHCAILDEPFDGAKELLSDLRSEGVYIACLSNTNSLHWPRLKREFVFSQAFASHLYHCHKPDAAAFELVQRQCNIDEPYEIIFFDDSEANVRAARDTGWQAHLVRSAEPVQLMRLILKPHLQQIKEK